MNTELMFSSKSGEWVTPKKFFKRFDDIYHFTTDAGASKTNALCKDYLGLDNGRDALTSPWGAVTWCNPPYGRGIGRWVSKGWAESNVWTHNSDSLEHKIVVMLLPGRVDTKWFHDYVWDKASQVIVVIGRIKFDIGRHFHKKTQTWCTELHPAPFPSIVVVYDYRTHHHGMIWSRIDV